jgi:histidinol dehydrogenase
LRFQIYRVSERNPEIHIKKIANGLRGLSVKEDKANKKKNKILSSTVSTILDKVRRGGDAALLELANEFDKSNFSSTNDFFVRKKEIEEAYSKLEQKDIKAIRAARSQIKFVAQKQMERFGKRKFKTPLGFVIEERYEPIDRAGGYVPGGLAPYPSTVLMMCVTANVARVKDIALATPAKNGAVNPAVLVAADLCGVKEILKIGGAQGIAALAFGTKSVKKADVIAGPGNEFVTEAKRQVASLGIVSIDMLAGPTELLILADSKANPRLVYEELVSQAEHGNKTLCGVVSDSMEVIDQVTKIAGKECNRERLDEISQSTLFAVKVKSISEGGDFAQYLSPEHLEVMVSNSNAKTVRSNLNKSGLVLFGNYAPCSSTDYIVGTNHVLPTGGQAARQSGLSVANFLKRVLFVSGTRASLRNSIGDLSTMARLEGLPNHAKAASVRLDRI